MSGFYVKDQLVTLEFQLGTDWSSLGAADMDVLLQRPSNTVLYTAGGIDYFIAASTTVKGYFTLEFTPDVTGRWVVDIMVGTSSTAINLFHQEIWVVEVPSYVDACLYNNTPVYPAIFGNFENWRMKSQAYGTDWDDAGVSPATSTLFANYIYGIDVVDDTKLFLTVQGPSKLELWRFDLASAWNTAGMTYHSHGPVGTLGASTRNYFKISSDGLNMLLMTKSSRVMYSYDLTVAFDASTVVDHQWKLFGIDFGFGAIGRDGIHAYSKTNTGGMTLVEYRAPVTQWAASGMALTGKSILLQDLVNNITLPGRGFTTTVYAMDISDDGEYYYFLFNNAGSATPDGMFVCQATTPWDIDTLQLLTTETTPSVPKDYFEFWGSLGDSCIDFVARSFLENQNDVIMTIPAAAAKTAIAQYGVLSSGFFKRNRVLGTEWNDNIISAPANLNTLLTNCIGMHINSSGTRMWISSTTAIYEFSFGTANEIEELTYVKASSAITSLNNPIWNNAGTVLLYSGSTTFASRPASIAYDVATLGSETSASTPNVETNSLSAWNPDGSLVLTANSVGKITAIALSTAYDVTTQSLTGDTMDLVALRTPPSDTNVRRFTAALGTMKAIAFDALGNNLYVVFGYNTVDPDLIGDCIYVYALDTPYDISSFTLMNPDDPYDLFETKQQNTEALHVVNSTTFISLHQEAEALLELSTHQLVV